MAARWHGHRITALLAALALGASLLLTSWVRPTPSHAGTCPNGTTLSRLLVPSCGALWGVAADTYEPTQGPNAHRAFEAVSDHVMGIYHYYYRGDTKFPRAAEIDLAREPGKPRLLNLNWKVADGMTWADVANGRANARIDAEAAYLKANYTDPFFLTIGHEPEDDVNTTAGSGMTAADYHNMFRHTVLRLRAQGVTNAVTVYNPMAYPKWVVQPWFETLYPGADVVDWVAWDPYYFVASATKPAWPGPDLKALLNFTENRTYPNGTPFLGVYQHMTSHYPGKPLMLNEWGVMETMQGADLVGTKKAQIFNSVATQLPNYPQLKALVYFDKTFGYGGSPNHSTEVDTTPGNLTAWRTLTKNPYLVTPPTPSPEPTPSPTPSERATPATSGTPQPTRSSGGGITPSPTSTVTPTGPSPSTSAPRSAPRPRPATSTPPPRRGRVAGDAPSRTTTPTTISGWGRSVRTRKGFITDRITVRDRSDSHRKVVLVRKKVGRWFRVFRTTASAHGTATVRIPRPSRPARYRIVVPRYQRAAGTHSHVRVLGPKGRLKLPRG